MMKIFGQTMDKILVELINGLSYNILFLVKIAFDLLHCVKYRKFT